MNGLDLCGPVARKPGPVRQENFQLLTEKKAQTIEKVYNSSMCLSRCALFSLLLLNKFEIKSTFQVI